MIIFDLNIVIMFSQFISQPPITRYVGNVVQSAKILLLPSKCEKNNLPFSLLLPIQLSLFQLCDSKSCRFQSLCFNFCMSFVDWFMASFLYCFPYSYHSSNYCDSNSCRSFMLLKALAKSSGNLFAIAFKSEKERQLYDSNIGKMNDYFVFWWKQ